MMAKKKQFVYRAIKDGVLNKPRYRHVKKGEQVVSDEAIKATWLKDWEAPVAAELPIMPNIGVKVNNPTPNNATTTLDPSAERYTANMEAIKKLENEQDGVSVDDSGDDAPDTVESGTGEQDVLG